MKKLIIIALLFSGLESNAQVGIGTNTPNTNAVLDLTSANKGFLLPRVNDTSAVTNPSAGLMIYNMNNKAPAFHNGQSWTSLINSVTATSGDSITYTIFGPGNSYLAPGEYPLNAISYGASNPGGPSADVQDVSFTKKVDNNSIAFVNSVLLGSLNGGIEFKVYATGSVTPYFSIKITNYRVSSHQQGGMFGTTMYEQVSVSPTTIGYKDWINNKSFSYNIATKVVGPY